MYDIDILNLPDTRIHSGIKGKFILFYGEEKIGKTTLMSNFDNILILSFEPGMNAIPGKKAVPIRNWGMALNILNQLRSPEAQERYDAIGIDTAGIAWDFAGKYVLSKKKYTDDFGNLKTYETIGDIPYGAGWGLHKDEFRSFLIEIANLGYGIILNAHEGTIKETQPDASGNEVEIEKIGPDLAKGAMSVINPLVDIIAYLRLVQTAEGEKRLIITRGTTQIKAGSRFKYLKPAMQMEYNTLMTELQAAIDRENEESGTTSDEGEYIFQGGAPTFEETIAVSKKLHGQLFGEDVPDEEKLQRNAKFMTKFEDNFGYRGKLSDVEEKDQQLLEQFNAELEEWVSKL